MDLPCKGNGTVNTQFPHDFFDLNRDHCIPVPLQGTHNSLNRNPGRRSKTRLPRAGIRIPFGETKSTGKIPNLDDQFLSPERQRCEAFLGEVFGLEFSKFFSFVCCKPTHTGIA